MGGLQIRSCSNCRHKEKMFDEFPCIECNSELNLWQTRRGAKAGVGRKPGAAKTGPKKFEDRGELKQIIMLSFKANDIKKAGGYQKVKEYLESIFYKLIKGL